MNPAAIAMQKWRSEPELKLFPPASDFEIRKFERRYDVRLPDDLRDFYRAANGFAPPNDHD